MCAAKLHGSVKCLPNARAESGRFSPRSPWCPLPRKPPYRPKSCLIGKYYVCIMLVLEGRGLMVDRPLLVQEDPQSCGRRSGVAMSAISPQTLTRLFVVGRLLTSVALASVLCPEGRISCRSGLGICSRPTDQSHTRVGVRRGTNRSCAALAKHLILALRIETIGML